VGFSCHEVQLSEANNSKKSELSDEFSKSVKAVLNLTLASVAFFIAMIAVTAYLQSGIATIIFLIILAGLIYLSSKQLRRLYKSLPCPGCEKSLFYHFQQPRRDSSTGSKTTRANPDICFCPYCGYDLEKS
jgi:hypothetical protein